MSPLHPSHPLNLIYHNNYNRHHHVYYVDNKIMIGVLLVLTVIWLAAIFIKVVEHHLKIVRYPESRRYKGSLWEYLTDLDHTLFVVFSIFMLLIYSVILLGISGYYVSKLL